MLRIIIAVILTAGHGIIAMATSPRASADECQPGYYWSASHQTCVQAAVPNMRSDAVLGQPCSNWQRYIFGYDPDGNILACAADVKNGTWVQAAPLNGVQQIGAPCAIGSGGTAQSPDGRALVCVTDMGWQPGP